MKRLFLWVVIAVVALEGSGFAQARAPRPGDFWLQQFAFGVTGELAGGLLGLGVLSAACAQFESVCFSPSYGLLYLPVSGGARDPAFLMMNLGRAAGALAGVAIAGALYGIEGNIVVAYMASGLWFLSTKVFPLTTLPTVPAVVATVSYNWGAKMRSSKKPATLAWQMQLVSLRF